MSSQGDDRPGREVPKDYRKIVLALVDEQGWRYRAPHGGGGHPLVFPADKTRPAVAVPTSPTSDKRAFRNFVAAVRRSGGQV